MVDSHVRYLKPIFKDSLALYFFCVIPDLIESLDNFCLYGEIKLKNSSALRAACKINSEALYFIGEHFRDMAISLNAF
jgi:hypothetical protein